MNRIQLVVMMFLTIAAATSAQTIQVSKRRRHSERSEELPHFALV